MRARTPDQTSTARTVGRNAQLLRTARGWPQQEGAARSAGGPCPLPLTAVRDIEAGQGSRGSRRAVSVDELVALAAVFGVAVERLLVEAASGGGGS